MKTKDSIFANIAQQLQNIYLSVDTDVGRDSDGFACIHAYAPGIEYYIALDSSGLIKITGTGVKDTWRIERDQEMLGEHIESFLTKAGYRKEWTR